MLHLTWSDSIGSHSCNTTETMGGPAHMQRVPAQAAQSSHACLLPQQHPASALRVERLKPTGPSSCSYSSLQFTKPVQIHFATAVHKAGFSSTYGRIEACSSSLNSAQSMGPWQSNDSPKPVLALPMERLYKLKLWLWPGLWYDYTLQQHL